MNITISESTFNRLVNGASPSYTEEMELGHIDFYEVDGMIVLEHFNYLDVSSTFQIQEPSWQWGETA